MAACAALGFENRRKPDYPCLRGRLKAAERFFTLFETRLRRAGYFQTAFRFKPPNV